MRCRVGGLLGVVWKKAQEGRRGTSDQGQTFKGVSRADGKHRECQGGAKQNVC